MMRKLSIVTIALLALPLAGCWEMELFSWSPDGRYLVIVDPNDGIAWRWDTVKQQPEEIFGLDGAEVSRFEFMSNREAFVFGSRFRASGFFAPDAEGLIKLNVVDGGVSEVPPGENTQWFAVSPDGRWIAIVSTTGEDEEQRYVVELARTNDVRERRVLAEFKEEVLIPEFDSTGSRLLLMKGIADDELPDGVEDGAEIVLLEFDTDTVTTKSYLRSFDEYPISPRWVGDDAFVYIRLRENDDSEDEAISALMLYSFGREEPELLHEPALAYFPASVSPDGGTLVFTATTDNEMEPDSLMQSSFQMMAIDLETREKTVLTNETFGAYAGVFHPTENRIAYATGEDPLSVRILDLDTGKRQLIWRDEEERLYTAAARFVEIGDTGLARTSFKDLLHRFPETRFRSRVAYREMTMHLDSPLNEFDEAVAAFANLEYGELKAQARPLLWQNSESEVSDPSGDLLRTYKTEASEAEFDHDTDRTRDLTSLEARWTPERLYLKIGLDSPYDLGGSVFQDLVLLFHKVGSTDGDRTITPLVDWEYPATRKVVIRHWYKAGKVYDLDVLNEKGEAIAKFAASGIETPSFPLFDIFDLSENINDDGGTIMCWLDRRAIGLRTDTDYYLQVCTLKGGIESYKGVERPREQSGWDIADAFGESNSKQRIDKEIAGGKKPALLGFATKLRIPSTIGR